MEIMYDQSAWLSSNDYFYTVLPDNKAMLIDYTGTEEEVTLPTTLDGHEVYGVVAPVFFQNRVIKAVTIPDSVQYCASNPFALPFNTPELRISPYHPTLKFIDGVLYDTLRNMLVCYPTTKTDPIFTVPAWVQKIALGAITGNSYLTTLILPDGLTSVSAMSCMGNTALEAIYIPDSVTSIGEQALASNSSLKALIIPENVTTIGNWAFGRCHSLTTVIMKGRPDHLAWGIFDNCPDTQLIALGSSDFSW